jgi:acyl-CoA thioesterase-1
MRKIGHIPAVLLFAAIITATFPACAQVVCLGASNTAGQGVPPQDAYPAQLELMLRAKGYAGRVVNSGISGETTVAMLARLDSAVPSGTQVVVLQPGRNDLRQSGNAAERDDNISKIVARLKSRQVEVVMLDSAILDAIPRQYLQRDGIHFTPEGYHLLASQLVPQVMRALRLPAN